MNNPTVESSQLSTRVYYGSSDSDKYHTATCRWVENILEVNLVSFNSIDEAKAKGYVSCGTCKAV